MQVPKLCQKLHFKWIDHYKTKHKNNSVFAKVALTNYRPPYMYLHGNENEKICNYDLIASPKTTLPRRYLKTVEFLFITRSI